MNERHLFDSLSLARGVIDGVKTLSVCGEHVLVTRESFEIKGRPLCGKCFDDAGDTPIAPSLTWVEFLERVVSSIQVQYGQAYNYHIMSTGWSQITKKEDQ